jgi:hypothetical protein
MRNTYTQGPSNIVLTVLGFFSLLLLPAYMAVAAEHQAERDNPLSPFEYLIGGQWHLEGSYQEFEWGIGKQSVKAKSYFIMNEKPVLVSEGIWYWDPGQMKIKGIFTAINMPVSFFDYTTRFDNNTMENDLRTYNAEGIETSYLETWEFIDDNHFIWQLRRNTPKGLVDEMGGTYIRSN